MSDPARLICADRCAEFGEPPCYELDHQAGEAWTPCEECVLAAYGKAPDPIDPNAVVRPLL